MTEIKLKKGESVERALRRLKKKVDREGTIKAVRNRRAFEKPSEKKRRKMKVAKFSAMLAARYAPQRAELASLTGLDLDRWWGPAEG